MQLRVTLAEDNPDLLRMFALWFELAGFDVTRASNGLEALESVVSHPPDILVTDLAMPVVDGFELIRRIRAHDEASHLPILSISAQGSSSIGEQAIKCGACDCIMKPCMPEALVGRARSLIGACRDGERCAGCPAG